MIWLLIIHILLCLLMWFMKKTGIIQGNELLLPMVICVPIGGFLIGIIHEYEQRRKKIGIREVALEKMKITDEKYRRIRVEEDVNKSITVPLEEAILINDAKTRRLLMLDVLHKSPSEYIRLLQKTRTSNDVELTHYATTTIMEVQSEFEARLQKYGKDAKEHPESEEIWDQFQKVLQQYINSGLLTPNILLTKRVQMDEILQKLCAMNPENKEYYLLQIENAIEQNQYDNMEEKLQWAKSKWPEERIYKLYMMYYQHTKQSDKLLALIKEIEEENIYLDHEGKEWMQFWNKGE